MRIGFVSGDDVNCDAARRMISPSLQLECRKNGDTQDSVAAWVYDLDQLSQELRNEVLARLSSVAPQQPVTVLSYSLTEEQIAALIKNGIRIERRLESHVFGELEIELLRRNGWGVA